MKEKERDYEIMYEDMLIINKNYVDKPIGCFSHAFETYLNSYKTDLAIFPINFREKLCKINKINKINTK